MKNGLGLTGFRSHNFGELHKDINKAADSVMSSSGEVSSIVFAEHLLHLINDQTDEELLVFLNYLLTEYDIDTESLLENVQAYQSERNQDNLNLISSSSEPKWIELFRRLNAAPAGTHKLIKLREKIKYLLAEGNLELESLDKGLLRLFKYWFNPSFLVLEKIDWSTPANVLEKIIEYEAVHEINSWDDLRARLAPSDRQCFAFFHPLIPEDPLIFVEVALTNKIPETIAEVIRIERDEIENDQINTAVFYSISNCQNGLSGISFGNFLIKKVAHELRQEIDGLDNFLTLSPLPGLMRWLENSAPLAYERCKNKTIEDNDLIQKTIKYLTESNRNDGLPNDPVGRFHLGNGAILKQININGDLSNKGLDQSNGVMVNYLYDLDTVERNHELFVQTKEVLLSNELKSFKKKYS